MNIFCMALANSRSFILGEEDWWTVQTMRKKKKKSPLSAAQCNTSVYTLVCRHTHIDKWTHNTHLPSKSSCEFYLITPRLAGKMQKWAQWVGCFLVDRRLKIIYFHTIMIRIHSGSYFPDSVEPICQR